MTALSKSSFVFLALFTAACGDVKSVDPGLDYGPEDGPLSGKDDSATSPASLVRLPLGSLQHASFSATSRWRAFTFAATAGGKLDIFVDGVRGLDTVAYIYNVSATTGRPYSRPIASNDDSDAPAWTLGTSTTPNPQSSSIIGFVPKYSRDYALVVTTYQQAGRGSANLTVRPAVAPATQAFVTGGTGVFVDLDGVRAETMKVRPDLDALANGTPTPFPSFVAAYRVAPATLKGALPAVIGSALGASLEMDPGWGNNVTVSATSPQRVGQRLADYLHDVHAPTGTSDAVWATVRANYSKLGAAMIADGFTAAYLANMDESGDSSYDAVVVVDTDSGDIRILGFRRDP